MVRKREQHLNKKDDFSSREPERKYMQSPSIGENLFKIGKF